ncbi:MAG TPA: glycosyltransferase [Bdellovibrionota bacterium]|nr:glycosyltransferase [Bdellovibrionota bacterium]
MIPVRNEPEMGGVLSHIERLAPCAERIVVDTTSSAPADDIWRERVRYLYRPRLATRADAMNEGAEEASGDILWFLHSDCRPPEGACESIEKAIRRGASAGAFLKRYVPESPFLRVQRRVLDAAARSRKRFLVGTNGFFVRRDLFLEEGKFPSVPLFEDVLIFDRYRRRVDFELLTTRLQVSSRKYGEGFGLPRIARNSLIYLAFRLGVSPHTLIHWYA